MKVKSKVLVGENAGKGRKREGERERGRRNVESARHELSIGLTRIVSYEIIQMYERYESGARVQCE